jgi:hypothetical protein
LEDDIMATQSVLKCCGNRSNTKPSQTETFNNQLNGSEIRVYLAQRAGRPILGTLLQAGDNSWLTCFTEDRLPIEATSEEVELCACLSGQATIRARATWEGWENCDGQPAGRWGLTTGLYCTRQRQLFRVPMLGERVLVTLGRGMTCLLRNVSMGGVGLISPTPLKNGETVRISFTLRGKPLSGMLRITNVCRCDTGGFACGLAVVDDVHFERELRALTMRMQREQLQQVAMHRGHVDCLGG